MREAAFVASNLLAGTPPSAASWPQMVISSLAPPAPKAPAVVVCGAEGACRGRPFSAFRADLLRPNHLPHCQVAASQARRSKSRALYGPGSPPRSSRASTRRAMAAWSHSRRRKRRQPGTDLASTGPSGRGPTGRRWPSPTCCCAANGRRWRWWLRRGARPGASERAYVLHSGRRFLSVRKKNAFRIKR